MSYDKIQLLNSEFFRRSCMTKGNEIEKIKQLYQLYGFTLAPNSDPEQYLIFSFSNGYFYNAEIIKFEVDDEETFIHLKEDYEKLGYSVRIIQYESYEKMHELLFNGFFSVKNVNSRLKREYEEFCQLQSSKMLDIQYEYIEPECNWNNSGRQHNLVKNILSQMQLPGAQLIIIEAAAGYGKTCTAYEIVKEISELANCAPIFTELSKNRKAALFRYVLLDEIDRKFVALSSDLVIKEIQNGKVPLIIDGFDELISQSSKTITEKNVITEDNSQTMLDTIAELFQKDCNTKVVLTSRKSAIFTGDIFEKWVSEHLSDKCTVNRVSIEEPTMRDWLGAEKTEYLKNQRIPFTSIINPILLAFMRSMEMDVFQAKCSNAEEVIQYYFVSLLDRERGRQSLMLNVQEQYNIMQILAQNFVEFEIVAEEPAFIRDLFAEIIQDNYKEYRDRYVSVEERPTEEEFAYKLAEHALLNRISPRKNDIGFINNFIFGIFIGDSIIQEKLQIQKMDSQFIDIACTAYSSRSDEKREELLKKVFPYLPRMNYEQQLDIEIKLSDTIMHNYRGHYISDKSFITNTFFDGIYYFQKCTFRNCVFKECIIMTSAFRECSFYDCKFYDVEIMRDTIENQKLIFSGNCFGHEEFMREAAYEAEIEKTDTYEERILKKYWATGNRFSKGRLPEMVLLKSQDEEERTGLEEALETLKKKEFLFKSGHYWFIQRDKIKEIKEMLGI